MLHKSLSYHILIVFVVLGLSQALQAQSYYYTSPLCNQVKTLRCLVNGDFRRLPVIDMQGNQSIEISFDYLADEAPHLAYSVIHCTADWEESDISELDYIEGFQPTLLTQIEPSFNTFIPYYHYSVRFPNPDIRLLLSGNYAVLFHLQDNPDEIVAVATFSISEQMMFVNGEISTNTDIDYRDAHQQLTLTTSWSNNRLPHLNPAEDLTLHIRQNRRDETRRVLSAPSRMEASKAYYEHMPALIFEAGNNYRRFEFVDEHYATLGVEQVRYHAPYFYISLLLDECKTRQPYYYDEDQDGRFLIHAKRVDDPDTEADYFWAQFRLNAPSISPQTPVYLIGDFTYSAFDETCLLSYDYESGLFVSDILLKQGAYNYQYAIESTAGKQSNSLPSIAADVPQSDFSTAAIEGNHYETPNEYDIMMYYRPHGARYDRLLGFGIIRQ